MSIETDMSVRCRKKGKRCNVLPFLLGETPGFPVMSLGKGMGRQTKSDVLSVCMSHLLGTKPV